MAGTVRTGHGHLHFTLNSDGHPHKLLNVLSVFVLAAGLAAFALGITMRNVSHPGLGLAIPAGVTGLISLLLGLYTQMMSATREQRMLIVTGIIAGFIGLAMGLAGGAFGG